MGSGVNCDHWRTECSKCGHRYHIVHGTTQCEDCRKEHYEYNWKTGKMVFVCYKDTPVTDESTPIARARKAKYEARLRLTEHAKKIREEMGC